MIPKYNVEYTVDIGRHAHTSHYTTDDPVACESFLTELLERGHRIRGIHHEGVELSKVDFDRMVKTAASMLAAQRICISLGIKSDEERFRFGFAA